MTQAMAALAPQGRAVVIAGHRHMVNLTAPGAVNRGTASAGCRQGDCGMTDAAPALDPRALRDAFGCFMTGVTVVTTADAEGKPLGFTANSFSSVSLDPPLLLVSIANLGQSAGLCRAGAGFAVNILAEGQKDISATFARPVDDRFAGLLAAGARSGRR
jgi:hypothetical protein